ncbi:hypothetical protein B0H14DRAFT_2345128, partial [Mycena olivaceomarginata]
EERFTCRVWLREGLRRFHTARIMQCPDVDALQTEMLGHDKVTHVVLFAATTSK